MNIIGNCEFMENLLLILLFLRLQKKCAKDHFKHHDHKAEIFNAFIALSKKMEKCFSIEEK
jgi:hypothetical protein